MAKQMVTISGENVNVREDTAKAYRGTHWALFSIAAFVLLTAILFLSGFFAWLAGPNQSRPATNGPGQEQRK